MKKLLVKSFNSYSVFKLFLAMGFLMGLLYGLILAIPQRIPIGIAGAIGITLLVAFILSYRWGLKALLYNLFACWFRGIKVTLIGEKELKNFGLWSVIRMAFPSLIIIGAILGLFPGVILDVLSRLGISHPILEYFPDFGTGVTTGAFIGFLLAIVLFLQAIVYNLFAYIYKGYQFDLEVSGENIYILKSLKIDSIFRLNLILGVIWGIIAALIISLLITISPLLNFLNGFSIGDLLIIGIIAGLLCACCSAFSIFFYNIFARFIGGIKLELKET